ncbi:hypothetical protein [Shouchella miscanthi]|uniref:hypothetical protein n=1 Tax=Shouchella miscanthi TaxID=2598861 RepID=UPI0011A56B96|nr:hypothetical protein [Shouchella miscanthi]
MLLKTIPLLVTVFLLISCHNNEGVVEGDHDTNSETTQPTISLENKIVPPKFNITSFNVDYVDEEVELFFNMGYEIDTDLYDLLTNGYQELYFSLEYPNDLHELLNGSKSEFVPAETPENYHTTFQTQFVVEKKLSKEEIDAIFINISEFNLLVADKDKNSIAQFIDINGFNNVDPEESNSTVVGEEADNAK